jgi:hypothetical protein
MYPFPKPAVVDVVGQAVANVIDANRLTACERGADDTKRDDRGESAGELHLIFSCPKQPDSVGKNNVDAGRER